MNKEQFLKELEQRLSQLPREEIRSQRAYYEELLADMLEDGMTEQEAVEKLGDPGKIADQILEDTPLHTLVSTRVRPEKGWTTTAVVLAVLGAPVWLSLGIAAVSIVFSLVITLWSLAVSLYAVTLSLGIGSIAVLVHGFYFFGLAVVNPVSRIGLAMLLLGLCGLGVAASYYVTKGMITATKWIFVKVKKLFIR